PKNPDPWGEIVVDADGTLCRSAATACFSAKAKRYTEIPFLVGANVRVPVAEVGIKDVRLSKQGEGAQAEHRSMNVPLIMTGRRVGRYLPIPGDPVMAHCAAVTKAEDACTDVIDPVEVPHPAAAVRV